MTWSRIAVALCLLVLTAAAVLVWVFRGREYTIRLSEAQLQEALDRRFPVDKTHLLIFAVRYSRPVVKLEEGSDRLHASVDAETHFKVNETPFSGSAGVSGQLDYDPATGEFRLLRARVDRLAIGGLPEKHVAKVNEVATLLLQGHLENYPVYRLKLTDVRHAAARLILRRVMVKDRHLEITLGVGP